MERPLYVLILAAGRGSRMKSSLPKVLQPLRGIPLVAHVLHTTKDLSYVARALVVSPAHHMVIREALSTFPEELTFIEQTQPLGTGHAVATALPWCEGKKGDLLVLCGDMPLLKASTIQALQRKRQQEGAQIAILAAERSDPGAYGRVYVDAAGYAEAIREHAEIEDLSTASRFCNAGILLSDLEIMRELLPQLVPSSQKGEFYLTDLVVLGNKVGYKTTVGYATEEEVQGVNSPEELAIAEILSLRNPGLFLTDLESIS